MKDFWFMSEKIYLGVVRVGFLLAFGFAALPFGWSLDGRLLGWGWTSAV
jgi:hypothetical protein